MGDELPAAREVHEESVASVSRLGRRPVGVPRRFGEAEAMAGRKSGEKFMAAKILIAEDQPDALVSMLHQLKGRGYLTLFATDGVEAVRLAGEESPDLIVCQWRFSTARGARVVGQFHAAGAGARVPVIALFDAAVPEIGGRKTPPGFAGYLVKPINPTVFIDTVERHIPLALRPSRLRVQPVGRRRSSDWALGRSADVEQAGDE
jgi:CheY-like chemotaxis protein